MNKTGKFTAIWQSEPNGRDWPGYDWIKRNFEPYIDETIFDGKHQVVLDNAILFDAWICARDPRYHEKFHGLNAFLVHPYDEFFDLGVDRYVHFRGVFRHCWSSAFNPAHVMVFPLGSYVDVPPAGVIPASERRYAWSFMGDAGKTSRPDMVHAMSSIEPHLCFSTSPVPGISFFDRSSTERKRIPQEGTLEILRQSVFSPSPMGNVIIECDRFYSALEVGAIPIVERRLTLDYYKQLLGDHPLPTVRSWSQARQLVNHLLKNPARLDDLQQTCMQWWKDYKSELIVRIGDFLGERSGTHDELVPLRSRLPHLPLWQYGELMRHHSLPALGRRVIRQATRVASKGKWRIAPTKLGDM